VAEPQQDIGWQAPRGLASVPDDPAVTTQDVQAAAEGVVESEDDRIEFLGAHFRLADNIGMMPLMAFANAQKEGLDSEDLDGMAAMYSLIRDTIDQTRVQAEDDDGKPAYDSVGEPIWAGPSEWQRFEKHCTTVKADGEELMTFIGKAMGKIAARPRKPRGTSSEPSRRTSEKSKDASSSPVTPAQALGLTAVADIR
jgi:hypothetical protein